MVLNAAISGDLVLRPEDDLMHPLGPEPNFNESAYLNFIDPTSRFGGWLRLGNRPNEGHAERTVCLYLPDGRVAFGFERAAIDDNSALRAGGLEIETVRPFEELAVTFDGELTLMGDGMEMADPRVAFTQNPSVGTTIRLRCTGLSPMYGGEPREAHEAEGEEVARGHIEQVIEARGVVEIGGERWELEGFGLRDRSWGPRYWQNVHYHRWLTGNFGARRGFMAVLHVTPSGVESQRGGFFWDGEELLLCEHMDITSTYRDAAQVHDTIQVRLQSGERSWEIAGEVLSLVPCRNRRDGRVTRISEGLTRWVLDGDVGYGLSEYLDQIVDGTPTGNAAGR